MKNDLMAGEVVNIITNRVVRLLGKDEVVRWLNLSLYQGQPAKKGFATLVRIPKSLIGK
jgi:peptidylprolyl isomerase domain and WD repeat-containing protein 1